MSLVERDERVIGDIEKLRFSPLDAVGGDGSHLVGEDGRRVLDLSANWGASSLGYSNPALAEAVGAAASSMAGSGILSTVVGPTVELAERLAEGIPGENRKVWFGHSGSDANEAAVRAIEHATGRSGFIVFTGAYHGGTAGSMAVSGHPSQSHAAPHPGRHLVPYPDSYRSPDGEDAAEASLAALDDLFERVDPTTIAAALIEPIMADGGMIVPPSGFLSEFSARCREHGILVLCDEVKVGVGRTGSLCAFEHEGLAPDLVTFGKGLGGGLPVSALVGPAEIMDSATCFAILTTAGNAVCSSAGLAVLEQIEEQNLLANAAERGEELMNGLREIAKSRELIGEVRGRGLAIGIDLVADRQSRRPAPSEAAKTVLRAQELGVCFFCVGFESNVLELTPPLNLSGADVASALAVIDQSLADVEAGLIPDEKIASYAGWQA